MRHIIVFFVLVVFVLSLLLPAPTLALSAGCDQLNDPIWDLSQVTSFIVPFFSAFEPSDTIVIEVTNTSDPGPVTIFLDLPTGTRVATAPAPGTLVYVVKTPVAGYVAIGIDVGRGDFLVSCTNVPLSSGSTSSEPTVEVPPDNRLNWYHGDLLGVLYPATDGDSPAIDVYAILLTAMARSYAGSPKRRLAPTLTIRPRQTHW